MVKKFVTRIVFQRQLFLVQHPVDVVVTGTTNPQDPFGHLILAEQLFYPLVAVPGTGDQVMFGQTGFITPTQLALSMSSQHITPVRSPVSVQPACHSLPPVFRFYPAESAPGWR